MTFTDAPTVSRNDLQHSHIERPRPHWWQEEAFPFESRFAQLGESRLHYIDEGPRQGPTLVFVAGSPMWSVMFRDAIVRCSRSMRCIAVDLPGLGLSRTPLDKGRAFTKAAALLGAFLDTLAGPSYVLCLHATAGPIGLAAASSRATKVAGLVISNSFAWPLDQSLKFRILVSVVSSTVFGWGIVALNTLPWLTAHKARRTGPMPAARRRALLGPYHDKAARRHLANYLRSLRTERDFFATLHEKLDSLSHKPTLLLYGCHDNGYHEGFLQRWQTLFADHETVLLQETGHFPMEDEPEQVCDTLEAWLSRRVAHSGAHREQESQR